MSISIPMNSTPANVFQLQFGASPGSQDPKAECERWQQLCGELLAERDRLRAELEKARLDTICKDFAPIPSMDEVFARIDRETSIDQLIADFKRELEAGK